MTVAVGSEQERQNKRSKKEFFTTMTWQRHKVISASFSLFGLSIRRFDLCKGQTNESDPHISVCRFRTIQQENLKAECLTQITQG